QRFGLLFQSSSIETVRNNLLNQHKQEQKVAIEWIENVLKNPQHYPNLVSNQTQQSTFYDYLQMRNHLSSSLYTLLNKTKTIPLMKHDHIVVSILYSKQDSDYREGKFYVGQILYRLLKNHHSRFIITLCENNNTNDQISDGIQLIRRLLPVFIVNSKSESLNVYEREKQAYLQCILANFQSFPNANYLLLLQDDAEPNSDNFYNELLSLIDNRIQQQWPLDGQRKQPAFIKIYHPRWLIGYLHPSIYIIIQLFATSLFLTLFFFFLFYLYETMMQNKQNIYQIQSQYYSRSSISNYIFWSNLISNNGKLLYFIFYFFLITFVLILLDHSNVSWTWRSLHPTFYAIYPAPSCCLPGVIHFRQTYTQVIEYLNSIECNKNYAIDTAFDDLPKRTNLQTYLVEPNLVHHIGLYSRLRKIRDIGKDIEQKASKYDLSMRNLKSDMVIKSLLPLSDEKEQNHKHEQHVLITEYLIGTNKTTKETKEDEHNIIAVSPNDHRWYRLIELRNGLRCMLVTNNLLENEEGKQEDQEQEEEDEKSNQHDTEGLSSDAEKAFFKYHTTTVALYIPAGSLLDPSNVQGLAHLTEHLIFSSSSKYPEMNCLDSFVSYHGGTIHAYTELEFTVIVIEISSNRVVETLDILIHSLIDPLMLSETIFDQIQIIDEESTIAQFDDHYRASRLLAHLAKENHPIRNFSWGNKTSLKDFVSNVNSTTILKQLVKDRYCIPEGMNLVMISDESFRVMQQRVERLFCLMKRSFKILPDYIGLKEPWNTDNFQKFHLVYPSKRIYEGLSAMKTTKYVLI
ncbi:unnamed protein product, partial [Rotaria socialis]